MDSYGIIRNRVYVGRFSDLVSRGDLSLFFQGFGPIKDVRVMTRFGFIELSTREKAESAVKSLNGKILKGSKVRVDHAAPPRIVKDEEDDDNDDDKIEQSSFKSPFGSRPPMSEEQRKKFFRDLNEFIDRRKAKFAEEGLN